MAEEQNDEIILPQDDESPLEGRPLSFANLFIIHRNGTLAYKKAGYKAENDNVAAAGASRLLRNVKVAEYIFKREQELQRSMEVTQERVLKEYARISFNNPKNFFDEEGNLKKINTLDDDTAATISSIEVKELFEGEGEERKNIGKVTKIRCWDKRGALSDLRPHVGLQTEIPTLPGEGKIVPVILLPQKVEINQTQIIQHNYNNGGNGVNPTQ